MIEDSLKKDLSQISLTGVRSLILFGLLLKTPMSLEEIKKAFIDYNVMEGSNSYDIIRIDINTLRSMGCEISRADKKTNNKFVLLSHPFHMNITDDEINVLKKSINKIKQNADIKLLLTYDELLKKIADHIQDKQQSEILIGLCPLKNYNSQLVEELQSACKQNKVLKLEYNAPNVKKSLEKDVIISKIIMRNEKLYLYGIDKNSKDNVALNVKRILRIISKSDQENSIKLVPIKIKFFLKDFGIAGLEDNENIMSGDFDSGFIIEGSYHNSFLAMQRILSFGAKCKVIEPEDFKENIVSILKNMRNVYNG